MILKDKYGCKWNIYQARSGKIVTTFGDKIVVELTKEQAETLPILSDESTDFNLFEKAYQ